MKIRRRPRVLAALLLAALLPACSQDFFDLEMHLGREDKTRPIAIAVEPPEAAPGDSVRVTLRYYTPFPDDCTLSWRLALDYNAGEFAPDYVERVLLPLDPAPPTALGNGLFAQEFWLALPDSALLVSSAIDDPVSDPATVALIRQLLPLGPDELPDKALVESLLATVTPEDLATQDPATQATVLAIADRFACRVLLRASIHCELDVDVTRTVTVRHSARLGSENANTNPQADAYEVLAIAHPDVSWADHASYAGVTQHYPLTADGPVTEIPRHADWTYYAVLPPIRESYSSALDGSPQREATSFRWYYLNLDSPSDDYALLRNDAGDETEMWALDESARLLPRAGESVDYRLITCLRDGRPDWEFYQFAPGLTVFEGTLRFVDP